MAKELGVDIPRGPELEGQLVVVFDLGGQFPHVTAQNAELIGPRASLAVLRPHLFVAEGFELSERFGERHGCGPFWVMVGEGSRTMDAVYRLSGDVVKI